MIPEREPKKQLPLPRKAAGAQIVQSLYVGETVKRNINAGLFSFAIGMSLTQMPSQVSIGG